MIDRWIAIRPCTVLAALAVSLACGGQATAPVDSKHQKSAILYPFVAASLPRNDPRTPSDDACPENTAAQTDVAQKAKPDFDPGLIDTIANELKSRLAKKMSVTIVTPATTVVETAKPTARALVFAGCITRTEAGNAAERMAGMGLGASHLAAHVRVLLQSEAGLTPVQEFDVEVKGSNLLPPLGPIGLVTHAASARGETLNGDAKKMADEILKKLGKLEKEAEAKAKQGG